MRDPEPVSTLKEGRRWAALGLAVPIWVLAVFFWSQDAIDPLTAPALLLDRSLQVLTLGFIPTAALVLFAPARPALYAVTFTAAVGLMLGGAVALSGVIRSPHQWLAVGLAVLALVCGFVLVVRYSARLPELRSVPGGAVAFLLASAIPALELLNNAAFLPSRTEPTLGQEVTVSVAAATADAFRTDIDFEVTNPTDVRILVLVTRMDVCWWSADEEPVFDTAALEDRANCTYSRPIKAESWVSPESSARNSRAVTVPRDHPRITVIARLAMARGDRVRTSDDEEKPGPIGPCRHVRTVRLEEESRVKSLAEPPKYLVYADFNGDGGLNFDFDTGPEIDCPPKDSSGLREYFGVTHTSQVREIWLTPPPKAG